MNEIEDPDPLVVSNEITTTTNTTTTTTTPTTTPTNSSNDGSDNNHCRHSSGNRRGTKYSSGNSRSRRISIALPHTPLTPITPVTPPANANEEETIGTDVNSSNSDNNNNNNKNNQQIDVVITQQEQDKKRKSSRDRRSWKPRKRRKHLSSVTPPPSPTILYSSENRLSKRNSCCFLLHKTLWSVSTLILVILVLGVALTGLAIWITSYSVTKRGTDDVARRTELTVTGGITDNVIGKGAEASEILLNVLTQFQQSDRLGVHISEFPDRRGDIATFISFVRYSIVSGIFFASEEGYFTGIFETVDGRFILSTSDANGLLDQYDIEPDTLAYGQPYATISNFNATDKPWYVYPKRALRPIWSSIFVSMSGPASLVIARGVPYYNEDRLAGILAVNLDLEQISSFLRELVVNATNTRVMILEAQGSLIGVSLGEVSTTVPAEPDDPTRGLVPLMAIDHSDLVIRETAKELNSRYGSPIRVQHFTSFKFKDSSGVRRLVAVNVIRNTDNINWLTVVVLKESEITGAIDRANRITLAVSLSAIALSVIIALIIGFMITFPLKKISRQMKRIANMDFEEEKRPVTLKLYEIDNMLTSMNQMQKALNNFQKYVPATVVKELLRRNKTVKLGVIPRLLTVLFLDIKDFTTISETTDPMILISVLEDFFTHMSAILTEHSGIIDKYIGDCIMALFNAPSTVLDHEYMAVASALSMQQKLIELNMDWSRKAYPYIQIRVGINTDTCLVGNVGSSSRVSYTALGDGVNTASRLESLNKRYGTKIIIGENTYQQVSGKILCMWLCFVSLKGTSDPIHVYAVLCHMEDATLEQKILCELHQHAQDAFISENDEELRSVCQTIVDRDPNDQSAREWLIRLDKPFFNEHRILQLDEK